MNALEIVAGSEAVTEAREAHRAAIRKALTEALGSQLAETIIKDRRYRNLVSHLTPSVLADPQRRAVVLQGIRTVVNYDINLRRGGPEVVK